MNDTVFRGIEVCRLTGITYRQLDYWARTQLLEPSITPARGSGTQRRYAYDDVVMAATIRNLLDAGVSLQQARRAVEHLRQLPALDGNVVISGLGVALADDDALVPLVRNCRGVLSIVSLDGIKDELNLKIAHGSHTGARLRVVSGVA